MKRRSLLVGAAGLPASGALLWGPDTAAQTRAHNAYFSHLNTLLKQAGPGRPVMLLDLDRMNRNIDNITRSVGPDKTYRVVVKSLPSVPLLEQVMRQARTRSLMVFHQPFLNIIARTFPDADVLMGKPMPLTAARTFYRTLGPAKFNSESQLQWLIDSHERLLQYQSLARELGVQMGLNFEIDVGLHRGGFAEPEALTTALKIVSDDPRHLRCTGLMGYEAHLTGLQAGLDHPAVRDVVERYRGFTQSLQSAGLQLDKLTLNGAGSHTLRIYERDKTMNDLAAGSGVVMPTDFDTFHLQNNLPALFIATPILKRYAVNPFISEPPDQMQQVYYIYGGYWKAKMASPSEIGDAIYHSTNQSPIATSSAVDLDVDDYMFLRPTQSEFVMLQFGDLLVLRGGKIVDQWPVFHETG